MSTKTTREHFVRFFGHGGRVRSYAWCHSQRKVLKKLMFVSRTFNKLINETCMTSQL